MCAYSTAKIGNKDINISMGYFAGDISINEFECDSNDTSKLPEELNKFTKKQLVSIIVQFVENGEEG